MRDVVTTAVIREALASVVREMRRMIVRSSYSSIIYEGYDFSCVIIDAHGRLIAQSGEDHPFHVIPVAWSVQRLLHLGIEIDPDSFFLHNDPYTGGTHLNDVAVVYPVFRAGELALFVVIRSHWGDVGGMTPGSLSGGAREILHEGLRLDHVRVSKTGRSEVMDLIFDNVRVSNEAVSDFHAVLATCRIAEARLLRLAERYGDTAVQAAMADVLAVSERRMRAAIADLPDGVYRTLSYLDGSSEALFPLQVELALTVEGDKVRANFTGSSPQVPAPLNAGPAIAPTSVLTIMKSFLDPGGVVNSGTLAPIQVTTEPGTILHAEPPAPCGGLNEVRFAADAAVMGALARVIPERITGDVRGTSNHTYIGGTDSARGREFLFYEYPSGGTGAFNGADGNPAVRAFNEGENVSIQSAEMIEARLPLRIERTELRPDSGGAGRQRGGCGLVREIRILAQSARFSTLSDRNLVPPFGVNGGRSGAPNHYSVLRDGAELQPSEFPGKTADFPLRHGDVVRVQSSGGGGYGCAEERDLDAVAADLADNVVTETGLADYSVEYRDGRLVRRSAPDDELDVSLSHAAPSDPLPRIGAVVGAGAADALGLEPGQMIECVLPTGPALRFWVHTLASDENATLRLSADWTELLPAGRLRLRATRSGTLGYLRRKA